MKLPTLPVHVETATELVRICFRRQDCQDGANSDDNSEEGEERSELVSLSYFFKNFPIFGIYGGRI